MHKNISVTCSFGKVDIVWVDCGYLLYDADGKIPIGGLTEEAVAGANQQQLVALVEKSQAQEIPFLR